mmetsp:Transcript_18715/g.27691  ORF Transcript_18715/g.27691 Transcript_18715/m.27691 type:complete len:505 (+) Transcript_18715:42-1556(+)
MPIDKTTTTALPLAASCDKKKKEGVIEFAQEACDFFTNSPDPFHAVANSTTKLDAAGFQALPSRDPFGSSSIIIKPGGKYYYTINQSTLVAFVVGDNYQPESSGFTILGGHTDSPNLKVKVRSKKSANHGCVQLGVECYGGGLWHTWFDRDLGISGRVLVRRPKKDNENDKKKVVVKQELVKLQQPVARVSTLCIHLQSPEERKSFHVNKENHTAPIIGTHTILQEGSEEQLNEMSDWQNGHYPILLETIAEELQIDDISDIVDWELNLFDVQPASLGGIRKEFLQSARLDNLATVFCAVQALASHSPANQNDVSLIAMFDHEEVGSQSAHGAGSPVMMEAVTRISEALLGNDHTNNNKNHLSATLRQSFLLSVDMAHAVHPNYSNKHESNHAPHLNAGLVIKINSNQRYTTNAVTGYIVREIARRNGNLPIQEFVVRNDCPCGTTIGPIIAERTGIRTVDVGMPQLSMHSCREMMGIEDLTNGYKFFQSYFKDFSSVDAELED